MTFIDTNLTYSKQVCDIAVGGYLGAGAVLLVLSKIVFYLIIFYLIYRVTQIFIIKYKGKELKSTKVEKCKGVKND